MGFSLDKSRLSAGVTMVALALLSGGCKQTPGRDAGAPSPAVVQSAPARLKDSSPQAADRSREADTVEVATTSPARSATPDFLLKSIDGPPVRLSDIRGKPVIVDFWATWCAPCRREIPELIGIYRRYRKQGLKIYGVSVDTIQGQGAKAIPPFVKEFKVSYPILLADQKVVDEFGVYAVPTTLFIGADGKLVQRIDGAGAKGELSSAAERLMKSIDHHAG